ncbi:MAG: hypothetical protein O2948_03865 [Proteobacteria bacterium]|nr:hypothetical protein [Pseudomonadota bacterium]MDA0928255.1 hypothetical protein [Pseudomonadota bacterium]
MPTASFPASSQGQSGQNQTDNAANSQADGQNNASSAGAGQQQNTQGGVQQSGQAAGTQSRLPGDQENGAGGRDSSTGDLNNGQSGSRSSNNGGLQPSGGDYSLDTLPSGVLSGSGDQQVAGSAGPDGQSGAITAAERAAILDERLRRGYETFDGFILGERERAQAESNAAGSVSIGGDAGGGGAGGGAQNQPQTMEEAAAAGSSGVLAGGPPASASQENVETFPPPEDIPSGRDDDVVARQLREAAMREPDPELREALWDEYRNYTGIGEEQ